MEQKYVIILIAVMTVSVFFGQSVLAATITVRAVHDNEDGFLKVCVKNNSNPWNLGCKGIYTTKDVDTLNILVNAKTGDSVTASGSINEYFEAETLTLTSSKASVELCLTC